MANTIQEYVTTYLPLLDEVYRAESKSANLDPANGLIKFDGANKIKLFEVETQGLANYSRADGYVSGSITAGWNEYTLTQDRGRSFNIDAIDDNAEMGMLMVSTMASFMREKVIPELDAYRFSTYAGKAIDNGNKAQADITVGTTDVPALVEDAISKMADKEVPLEGLVLYMSEKAYAGLKSKITRTLSNEKGVVTTVETYDGIPVVRVPSIRFNTAITLKTGASGQEAGGYVPTATTGYPINFMLISPTAVRQAIQREAPKMIPPELNQKADGWGLYYRIFHDALVLTNKVNGIFCHYGATANA